MAEPEGGVLSGESILLDAAGQTMSIPDLLNRPEGTTAVVTMAPAGHAVRLVMDRDGDGVLNHDEWLAGSDPRDPSSVPVPSTDLNGDGDVGFSDVVQVLSSWGVCCMSEDLTGKVRSTLPIFLKSCPALDLADTFCQRQLLFEDLVRRLKRVVV